MFEIVLTYCEDCVLHIHSLLRLQTDSSFMTFEGLQIQGAIKIMEKLSVSTCNK